MKKSKKYDAIISYFLKNQPGAQTELHYSKPYELFVAVCLSAQCTDKRVNIVTKDFFQRFPNVHSLSEASKDEIFEYIKSISFPNNKAKNLFQASQILMDKYQGNLPQNFEELIRIPGVGRKTANVLLSVLFDIPAMAVDTHVFRVSHRLGLVSSKANTPEKVEQELTKHIPKKHLNKAHHWLILHGRYICVARRPKCDSCALQKWCLHFTQNQNSKKK